MKKKILSLLLVIGLLSTFNLNTYAKNTPVKVGNENKIINTAFDLEPIIIGYGYIKGYGVRFRKGPSTSSTILGLFDNEENLIEYYRSDCPSDWIYVYREKTRQFGYVHSDYFVSVSEL